MPASVLFDIMHASMLLHMGGDPLALGSSNRRLIIRVRLSQLHVPVQFKNGDKVYAMVDTIQKPGQEGSMPSSTLAVSCMGADLVYIYCGASVLHNAIELY